MISLEFAMRLSTTHIGWWILSFYDLLKVYCMWCVCWLLDAKGWNAVLRKICCIYMRQLVLDMLYSIASHVSLYDWSHPYHVKWLVIIYVLSIIINTVLLCMTMKYDHVDIYLLYSAGTSTLYYFVTFNIMLRHVPMHLSLITHKYSS